MDINIDSSIAMLSGALPVDGQDNNKGLIIAHQYIGIVFEKFRKECFFIIKCLSYKHNYFLVKFA